MRWLVVLAMVGCASQRPAVRSMTPEQRWADAVPVRDAIVCAAEQLYGPRIAELIRTTPVEVREELATVDLYYGGRFLLRDAPKASASGWRHVAVHLALIDINGGERFGGGRCQTAKEFIDEYLRFREAYGECRRING